MREQIEQQGLSPCQLTIWQLCRRFILFTSPFKFFWGYSHYTRFDEAKWDKGGRNVDGTAIERSVISATSHASQHQKKKKWRGQLLSMARLIEVIV